MTNFIWSSIGHKCLCSECGKEIADDDPRYVPLEFKPGRICVECYDQKEKGEK